MQSPQSHFFLALVALDVGEDSFATGGVGERSLGGCGAGDDGDSGTGGEAARLTSKVEFSPVSPPQSLARSWGLPPLPQLEEMVV